MNRLTTNEQRKRISQAVGVLYFTLLSGCCLLTAGWICLTTPNRYRAEVKFRANARLTTGTVIWKEKKTTSCSGGGILPLTCNTQCNVQVMFKPTEGQVANFWDSCPTAFVHEKQSVAVLYAPTTPNSVSFDARIDRKDSPASRAGVDIVTGLFIALSGIGLFVAGLPDDRTA